MLINSQIKDSNYCPYIKTEETINSLLVRDKDLISDDYELMPYPLAHWINTIGINRTNDNIRRLKSDKKRIFICQHIRVDQLSFLDTDLIFTPHSSKSDRFISIPHYAVNVDKGLMIEDRSIEFSFIGSITTHRTRKLLVDNYPNCFDSKLHWGLEKGLSKDFTNNYIKLLGDSIFSMCPRGTGISSVRLFESMAMGSIPVIIADDYDPPLSNIIDWDKISLKVNEGDVSNGMDIFRNVDITNMRREMLDIYNDNFSNENLHKTIIKIIIRTIK